MQGLFVTGCREVLGDSLQEDPVVLLRVVSKLWGRGWGAFRMLRDGKYWFYEGTAIVQYRSPVGASNAIQGLDRTGIADTEGREIWAEAHFEEFNLRAMDMVEFGSSPQGPRVSIAGDEGFLARRSNGWSVTPDEGLYEGVQYYTR